MHEKIVELTFHGVRLFNYTIKVEYLIRVDTLDGLTIRLEQKNNGD